MISKTIQTIKDVLDDKKIRYMGIFLLTLSVLYSIWLMLGIESQDALVTVQHSVFGREHYYRGSWIYYYSLIVASVMFALIGITILQKMKDWGRKDLQNLFFGISVLVQVLLFSHSYQLMGIAF